MSRFTTQIFVLLLLAATAGAQYQLATPNDLNNGAKGVMFDVQATNDLRLTGIDVRLESGLNEVEVYRVTAGTSFVGHENDGNAWTLLGRVTVFAPGGNTPVHLPLPLNLNLPAGTTQGLYVTSTVTHLGGLRYRDGVNGGGIEVSNSDLEIREGVGKNYPFGSTFGNATPGGSSRKFRGVLHYELGIIGTTLSVAGALTLDDSEESITFNLRARQRDVILDRLDVDLIPGNHDLRLWVAEGYESSTAAGTAIANWRLIGSVDGFNAPGGRVRLPMDFEAVIPKGKTRGFYLTTSHIGGIECQNIAAAYQSADVTVTVGKTYLGTFGPEVAPAAMISATFFYRIPEQGGGITAGGTGVLSADPGPNGVENGVWFDLVASEALVVEGFEHNLTAGTHTIEVWAVTGGGSFASNFNNQAAWTRISSEVVTVPTAGKVNVASDLRLFIPAGGVQGIYLTGTGSPNNPLRLRQDSSAPTTIAQDASLAITKGFAGDYPFIQQLINMLPIVTVQYEKLGDAPTGFFEDFSSASGIQPPMGWISSFEEGNRAKLDGWRFDNPGSVTVNSPVSAPFAICDSDDSGSGNSVAAALVSPRFDASVGAIELNFDQYFRQFGASLGTVEVWDGSVWNLVSSYNVTTANSTSESFDITAAAGGSSEAMLRFRYTGNFDWYWAIDNVEVAIGQKGQRPQLGIGEFDINYATDALHGQPVSAGLPGPYEATANVLGPTVFRWEGEPNQPIQLFAGNLNLANVVLTPQGQLDVGSYDPVTNTFPGILLVADGTAPDIFNAAFRTSNAGECAIVSYLPPFIAGMTIHFQSVVFSSTQNIALTNVVSLTVDP